VQGLADRVAKLEVLPKYSEPVNKADYDKESAAIRAQLFKLELIAEGLNDLELKGVLKNLRGRLDALEAKFNSVLKALCDIEDPESTKWTPAAIEAQCKKARTAGVDLDVAVERAKSVRLHFPVGVGMSSGPQGMQTYLFTGLMLEGKATNAVRVIAGLDIAGTFMAPKTGGQAFIWPYAGLRFWVGPHDQRNALAIDARVGLRQNISTIYGYNPEISGRTYENSQFWGSYATFGLDATVRATTWLSVGAGGWIGYGWWLSTVPNTPRPAESKTLPESSGIGGGGRLFLSFSF